MRWVGARAPPRLRAGTACPRVPRTPAGAPRSLPRPKRLLRRLRGHHRASPHPPVQRSRPGGGRRRRPVSVARPCSGPRPARRARACSARACEGYCRAEARSSQGGGAACAHSAGASIEPLAHLVLLLPTPAPTPPQVQGCAHDGVCAWALHLGAPRRPPATAAAAAVAAGSAPRWRARSRVQTGASLRPAPARPPIPAGASGDVLAVSPTEGVVTAYVRAGPVGRQPLAPPACAASRGRVQAGWALR